MFLGLLVLALNAALLLGATVAESLGRGTTAVLVATVVLQGWLLRRAVAVQGRALVRAIKAPAS